jgi:hypothetical protein
MSRNFGGTANKVLRPKGGGAFFISWIELYTGTLGGYENKQTEF